MNYQVGICNAADIPQPVIPEPTDGHGWTVVEGKLEPKGFLGPASPTDIAAEDDSV